MAKRTVQALTLIRYRRDNELSQVKLAKALKVSDTLISMIEIGEREVTPRRALQWHAMTRGRIPAWRMRPDLWPEGGPLPKLPAVPRRAQVAQ